jgi:hypothetical protein
MRLFGEGIMPLFFSKSNGCLRYFVVALRWIGQIRHTVARVASTTSSGPNRPESIFLQEPLAKTENRV